MRSRRRARRRRARGPAPKALTLALVAATVVSACGAGRHPTPAALHARRVDLARVGRSLLAAEGALAAEVLAARRAWPYIDRGLRHLPAAGGSGTTRAGSGPRSTTTGVGGAASSATGTVLAPAVALAAARADALAPGLVPEETLLTGAASGIASAYARASGLIAHGWEQVAALVEPAARGSAAPAARGTTGASEPSAFLRANIDTYIVSIYDGHFDLSLLGKALAGAYRRLGGPAAFGGSLTDAQVRSIESAYSPAMTRLRPHPWHALIGG